MQCLKLKNIIAWIVLQKALNGDGINWGFVKVIKEYSGTEAGNLAHFYAGDCYLRTGDFNNAVKHLKEFCYSCKTSAGKSL